MFFLRRFVCVLGVLTAPVAQAEAESVVVQLGDSNVSQATVRMLERAADAALSELSALKRMPARGGMRRGCLQDLTCLQSLPGAAGADHAWLIRARQQSGGRVALSTYWVDGERGTVQSRAERTGDASEATVRELLAGLLPPYTRKGYGALVLKAERGAVVKVDGRKVGTLPLDAPVVLPAGAYGVDVVLPSGASVLREEKVKEAERTPVVLESKDAFGVSGNTPSEKRLWASYGLWGASALAITGAFIAGSISRRAEGQLRPCSTTGRDCTSFEEAQQLQDRSDRYARNANILLGTGLVLGAAGGGLFGYTKYREAHP